MELLIAIGMMGIVGTTVIFVYQLHFKSWNEGYVRSVIRGNLSQALDIAGYRLRHARTIDAMTENSVTFTADLGSGSKTYRLYLYNADDPEPNPPYTQNTYSLRFAQETVDYGNGAILSRDIARPSGPVFVLDGKVIAINLTAARGDEHVTMRTKIRPRNL